jgi:outer membrane usher protein
MSRFRRRLSLIALVLAAMTGQVRAQAAPANPTSLPLQLEVVRNGAPSGLIVAFTRLPDGRFTTTASELRALGLVAPDTGAPVALDDLPGVSFRYDDDGQRMFIQARPSAITPLKISLRDRLQAGAPSRDAGAVLNYSFSAGAGHDRGDAFRGQGLSAAVEARVFGSFGMASSAFTTTATPAGARAVRLETSWTLADPKKAATLRAGDTISGGFAWTRPVRMAGVQWRRDFATRPDLVTTPNVVLSATAAAPSTLEVMLGQTVVMSRQVSEGPVTVSDLPVVQGRGEATLVLRDAAGVAQTVVASYFASPDLLRRGLVDFSVEAGFTRRSFGYVSDDYDRRPVASGSARYGLSDVLTLQAHGEAGAGLANLSLAASGRMGDLGVGSLAVAQSRYGGRNGALLAAAFETRSSTVVLSAQAQQTFGSYRDLAAVTADQAAAAGVAAALPPRSLLQVALSTPVTLKFLDRLVDTPVLSVSYGQSRSVGARRRSLLSAALRFLTAGRVSVQASAYASASGLRERGVFIGVTAPLGGDLSGSAGLSQSGGRTAPYAEVRREERLQPGDVAWRLRADEGAGARVEGEAVYRSTVGRLAARAASDDGAARLEGRIDGALVWMGGPMLAPDRVDGAFAVVDVGAPRVQVLQDNRPVGRSDGRGRLLALNLNAFSPNTLSIEETEMPLDFTATQTRVSVRPPYGAGAWVRFGVSHAPLQGLVGLRLANGDAAPAGARATLNGGAQEVLVGYDGLAFVVSSTPRNSLRIDLGGGRACTATFTLTANGKGIVHVPDTVCS